MKLVNSLLNQMKNEGTITGRCAACIRRQFAHRIAPQHHEPCGLDADARAVLDFGIDAFERIRAVVDPDDAAPPIAEFRGTHLEVASGSWIYVLDTAGRQVFRPTAVNPHMTAAFLTDIGPILDQWSLERVPVTTVDLARDLALTTFGVEYPPGIATNIVPARELLTTKCRNAEAIEFHEGRTMVLFRPEQHDQARVVSYRSLFGQSADGDPIVTTDPVDLPFNSYETAITFAPAGHPMRVESDYLTPDGSGIVGLYRDALTRGSIPSRPYPYETNLKFGSFFAADEPRLELTAYSFEGEQHDPSDDFLKPDHPCWELPSPERICNPWEPFDRFGYCYNSTYAPDADLHIRPSREYRAPTFEFWNYYARQNGIRGKWDEGTQSWEFPTIDIAVHADLGDYELLDDWTLEWQKTCDTTDDYPVLFPFWHSEGNKLEQKFYDDLESCHVVMINTHGGPISSHRSGRPTFQFMSKRDNWVALRDDGDDGLGKGRLRHLFLETCSNMNWRNNWRGQPKTLAADWLNDEVADGIRTAAGFDGGRTGWHVTGWRFFGSYNRGESVSQSWINMALEENECHAPIVVAYGATKQDAAETLFDGRFSKTRAAGNCAMASGPQTEKLLEPRACCMYDNSGPASSYSCVELPHHECELAGGFPLDPCTNCAEDSKGCKL
jgi:hypothetical protein